MKRFILALLVILVMACPAVAQNRTHTLLNAATTLGDGSAVTLTSSSSIHSCQVVFGGVIPTNVVVKLKGSVDGTNYMDLASATITPTDYISNGALASAACGTEPTQKWTCGAGWADGTNNIAKTTGAGTLGQALTTMAATPALGENYLLNFTISSWTKGNPTVTFMGATASGTTVTTDATIARTITTSATSGGLLFTPAATDDAYVIDDIKLIRNDGGFHVVNKEVFYVKGSYVSRSGGSSATTVTMTCTSPERNTRDSPASSESVTAILIG